MATSIFGTEGWLFLNNDSNHCRDKQTGKVLLPDDMLAEWDNVIKQRQRLCKNLNIDYIYIIIPDKECVYSEYLPYKISDKRIAIQLANRIENIIYPIEFFSRNKHKILYHKTDTHWNELGVLLFFNSISHLLHSDQINEFQIINKKFTGDLGNKCDPKVDEDAVFVGLKKKNTKVVYENGIINRGNITITKNQNPDLPVGAIFGDSFARGYLELIAEYFSTLYFFHTQTFDINIIKALDPMPEVILQEQSERFLFQIEKKSFFEYLCDKVFTKDFSAISKISHFQFDRIFDGVIDYNLFLKYIEHIKSVSNINQFYLLRYRFLVENNISAIWQRNFTQNYFSFQKNIQAIAFGFHYNDRYGRIAKLELFIKNIEENSYFRLGIYDLNENSEFVSINKKRCLYDNLYQLDELQYNTNENKLAIDLSFFKVQNNSSYLFVIEAENCILPGQSSDELETGEYFLRGYMRFANSGMFLAFPCSASLAWKIIFSV